MVIVRYENASNQSGKQEDTYTWCRTKIDQDLALLKEPILFIQLDQFERSTSTVALLLGQAIPLIQTTFSVLGAN
jgi:hypothetical protein